MRLKLKLSIPFSTLQLAGLFVYALVLTTTLTIAAISIGLALRGTVFFNLIDNFLPGMTLAILFPVTGGTLAYLMYQAKKKDTPSFLPAIAACVVIVLLNFALGKTVFAFTYYVLILAAAVILTALMAGLLRSGIWKNLLIILSLICATLSLFLCVVEGILVRQHVIQITSRFVQDRSLDFPEFIETNPVRPPGNLKANLDTDILLGNGSIGRVRTNEMGFRNAHPIVLPKPAGEFRVLFLGDSFTSGYRTDQTRTAAFILEERLRAALNIDVRVYPAWTEDQYGMTTWLRSHRNLLEADLILHGICLGNDLVSNLIHVAPAPSATWKYTSIIPAEFLDLNKFKADGAYAVGSEGKALRSRLRLTQALKSSFFPTPISAGIAVQRGAPPMWNLQNTIGLFLKDEIHTNKFFEIFARKLTEADNLSGKTPLHSVVFPQRYQQSESEWQTQVAYYGLDSDSFDLDLPNRKINEICQSRELNCFDLLPTFRANGDKLLHYPYDMHWNDEGNRIAGETMADYLAPIVAKMQIARD